jgi:hypothetical protein
MAEATTKAGEREIPRTSAPPWVLRTMSVWKGNWINLVGQGKIQ